MFTHQREKEGETGGDKEQATSLLTMHIQSGSSGGTTSVVGGVASGGKGAAEREKHSLTSSVLSCLMYSGCSVGMVLSNKAIAVAAPGIAKDRIPQITVIFYQCFLAVVMVAVAKQLKIVEYPAFNIKTAFRWLPVNIMFILMLSTGLLALMYVNVPMVTAMKNCSNLITIAGDYYVFKENQSFLSVFSVLLMTLAALMAAHEDLEFNVTGYFFLFLNLVSTSGYVLVMRYATTTSDIQLPRFGMLYYNNLISAMLLLPICFIKGELPRALFDTSLMTQNFLTVNTVAAVLGFYLNFASLWCVSATSATTYAIIGSLNKIPITILGFLMFDAKMTEAGVVYILIATLAGFLYAYSKLPTK